MLCSSKCKLLCCWNNMNHLSKERDYFHWQSCPLDVVYELSHRWGDSTVNCSACCFSPFQLLFLTLFPTIFYVPAALCAVCTHFIQKEEQQVHTHTHKHTHSERVREKSTQSFPSFLSCCDNAVTRAALTSVRASLSHVSHSLFPALLMFQETRWRQTNNYPPPLTHPPFYLLTPPPLPTSLARLPDNRFIGLQSRLCVCASNSGGIDWQEQDCCIQTERLLTC